MSNNHKYHFIQDRSISSINNNNETYIKLIKRFQELVPVFKDHGLEVFNCNLNSNLKVFPFIPFREAFFDIIKYIPDIENERTDGLYDRLSQLKRDKKQ